MLVFQHYLLASWSNWLHTFGTGVGEGTRGWRWRRELDQWQAVPAKISVSQLWNTSEWTCSLHISNSVFLSKLEHGPEVGKGSLRWPTGSFHCVHWDLCALMAFTSCIKIFVQLWCAVYSTFLLTKGLGCWLMLVQKAGKPCLAWEDLGPCYLAAGQFRNWVKDGRFMGRSTAAAQLLKLGGGTPRFWFMLKDILSIFYSVIILWKKKCINCPDC